MRCLPNSMYGQKDVDKIHRRCSSHHDFDMFACKCSIVSPWLSKQETRNIQPHVHGQSAGKQHLVSSENTCSWFLHSLNRETTVSYWWQSDHHVDNLFCLCISLQWSSSFLHRIARSNWKYETMNKHPSRARAPASDVPETFSFTQKLIFLAISGYIHQHSNCCLKNYGWPQHLMNMPGLTQRLLRQAHSQNEHRALTTILWLTLRTSEPTITPGILLNPHQKLDNRFLVDHLSSLRTWVFLGIIDQIVYKQVIGFSG